MANKIVNTEKITKKDDEKIKPNALYMVKEFESVLNMLSLAPGMDSTEVNELIRNRYADDKRKIFYDSAAVIDDDLWNTRQELAKKIQQKQVQNYLCDFDIYYRKSDSASVIFSNMQVSNVKKGDYLYIKVFFDCHFTGKPRFSDSTYRPCKRTAELKVEKTGNKWRTWIINVQFLTTVDSVNKNKNDITVIDEPVNEEKQDSTVGDIQELYNERPTAANTLDPVEKEKIRKEYEVIRNEWAFKKLLSEADDAYQKTDYPTAYQKYQYALNIKPGEDYPKTMSEFAKKKFEQSNLSTDQQYLQWIQKAKIAEGKRKYEEARDGYNHALNLKSEDEPRQKIQMLTEIINTMVKAETKYNTGDYKGAIRIYEQHSEDRNPDYLLGLGKCYEKLNEWKQALKAYTTAIQLDPNHHEAYYRKAAVAEHNKNFTQAIIDYTICYSLDKKNVDVLTKLGDLHKNMGNLKEAKDAYTKAINLDSTNALLFHKKGEVLFLEKNTTNAWQEFNRSLLIDTTNALTYYYKGLCEVELKSIQVAGSDFARALNLGLDNTYRTRIQFMADSFYQEGVTHYNNKKIEAAISSISHSISIDPSQEEYYYKRGECYLLLKGFDSAIINYTKSLQINPRYYDAYQQRGLAYYNLGMYKEGIKDLENTAGNEIRTPQTYKNTGDGYFMLREFNAAIRKYDTALLVAKSTKKTLEDNTLAELFNRRGECCYQLGNYSNALENFKSALRYKDDGNIYLNRGKTYFQLRLLDEAEKDLVKALSYQQNKPFWNYLLGQVYQCKGQFDKAIQQYNQAQKIDLTHSLGTQPVYQRAICNTQIKNSSDALKDYLFIKSQQEDHLYEHFDKELGFLYLEVHEPDSALIHFKRAVDKDITNADATYGMAIALVQKQAWDQSLTWFEKAFASGKFKRTEINKDRRINPITNQKPFKSLMKKYF